MAVMIVMYHSPEFTQTVHKRACSPRAGARAHTSQLSQEAAVGAGGALARGGTAQHRRGPALAELGRGESPRQGERRENWSDAAGLGSGNRGMEIRL